MSLWLFLTGIVGVLVGAVATCTGLVLEVRALGAPGAHPRAGHLGMLTCYGLGLAGLPLLAAVLFSLYTVFK